MKINLFKNVDKFTVQSSLLLFITCLFAFFTTSDIDVNDNHLESLCLVLIQIEATMTAVLIAVIALLSSFSTKSYLGFSLISYVLDLKPKIFKFHYVLIIEFVLLFIVILGQILQFYPLIFLSCAFSVWLIIRITHDVYDVFINANRIYVDIKRDFEDILCSKKFDYKNFILDWKQSIKDGQSEETFELYKSALKKIISCYDNGELKVYLFDKDGNKSEDQKSEFVKVIFNEIAEYLLKSDEIVNNKRGFEFVRCFYKGDFVLGSNKNGAKSKEKSLFSSNVFNDVVWELWWKSLSKFDCDYIEKVPFYKIFELMYFNDFPRRSANEQKNSINPLLITGLFGGEYQTVLNSFLIAFQFGELYKNQIKNKVAINDYFWKGLIIPKIFDQENIDKSDEINLTKIEAFEKLSIKIRSKIKDDVSDNSERNDTDFFDYISLVNFYVFKGFLLSGDQKLLDYIKQIFSIFELEFKKIESDDTETNDYLELLFLLICCFLLFIICSDLSKDKKIL